MKINSGIVFNEVKNKYLNPYFSLSAIFGFLYYPLLKIKNIREKKLPLLKLINHLFVNNVMATFLSFLFQFIFLAILPLAYSAHVMIIGTMSMMISITALVAMPLIIVSLKKSSLLKRIGASDIKPIDINIVIIFYFLNVIVLSQVMGWLFTAALYSGSFKSELMHWPSYIFSTLFMIILCLSAGFFISSISRDPKTASLIGLIISLPASFITGQMLPIELINRDLPFLKILGFIFPQKAPSQFQNISANTSSSWHIFQAKDVHGPTLLAINGFEDRIIDTNVALALEKAKDIPDLEVIAAYEGLLRYYQTFLDTQATFVYAESWEIITSWITGFLWIIGFNYLSIRMFKWSS